MRVLVVEDDPDGGTHLVLALMDSGHDAECASNFAQGLTLAESGAYDAIVVDRRLPGGDGLNLVASLRSRKIMTPAIFLTAICEVDDRIAGLRAGGDDYIAKPFSFFELLARLEAVTRRAVPETTLRVGDLEMNLVTRTVKRANKEIELAGCELRLLEYLMRNAGKTVTRAMLFENIWKFQSDTDSRMLDVQVSRLRKKIDRDAETPLIHTIWGSGYSIRVD